MGRSTNDHLVRLEAGIRTAFSREEHFVVVFFDLEKAYDRTWRYGILEDMNDAELRGRLPMFIRKYLKDRTIRVRVDKCESDYEIQQNGVPQGSVLAVTLFLLRFNNIVTLIPSGNKFHVSLYVEDFQLGYHHSDLDIIQQQLQGRIIQIHNWAFHNEMKFSASKTKAVHLNILPGLHRGPEINRTTSSLPMWNPTNFWECSGTEN